MTEGKRHWNPLAVVLLLSAGFFALFLVISAVVFFSKPSGGWQESGKARLFSKDGIGVLELKGVIMDSKKILKRLKRFEENDAVQALVLRINSPGGGVAPSQEIYEAVKKFPKLVVVSMDSLAASG